MYKDGGGVIVIIQTGDSIQDRLDKWTIQTDWTDWTDWISGQFRQIGQIGQVTGIKC